MRQTRTITIIAVVACGSALLALNAAEQNMPKSRPAGRTLLPIPKDLQPQIPPQRTREEIKSVLQPVKEADIKPLRIVLVAGPKDHGPGEHDYPAFQNLWRLLLADAPKVHVGTAWEKPSADDLKSADVLVMFKRFSWPRELNEQIDAFLARGGGIVLLHFAVDPDDNAEFIGKHIGLYWDKGSKYRHGQLDLEFTDSPQTPFLKGLAGKKIRFHDESYWRMTGDVSKIDVMASAMEDDGDGKNIRVPLIWNLQDGKGRVHVNILGHYNWTFNDPMFRVILLRGIAWAADQPIDRFGPVVTQDVLLK